MGSLRAAVWPLEAVPTASFFPGMPGKNKSGTSRSLYLKNRADERIFWQNPQRTGGLASGAAARAEGQEMKLMRATIMIALVGSLACVAFRPSLAAETPFAAPPLADPGQPSATPSTLAEIMGKVQMRHIKLWYAIKGRSFDLVSYELGHLRDTFVTAVILYRNIPVELIAAADKPLAALEDATQAKDAAAAERSFAALTASCNACHAAAGIGYILIHTPTAMPFSNQSFGPGKK